MPSPIGCRSSAQFVLFVLALLVTYLMGRLVVVPAIRRILEVRDVNRTIRQPGVRALHAFVVLLAVWVGLAVGDSPVC